MVQTTLKRSGMDHTAFNLQRTPCLPLPRKRSPDGAPTEGWVGLVGWPIADDLPTYMVTHQLWVECRTTKERWPETDVLPLSHADHAVMTGTQRNVAFCTGMHRSQSIMVRSPVPVMSGVMASHCGRCTRSVTSHMKIWLAARFVVGQFMNMQICGVTVISRLTSCLYVCDV